MIIIRVVRVSRVSVGGPPKKHAIVHLFFNLVAMWDLSCIMRADHDRLLEQHKRNSPTRV
jgi:hypothetical protein